jgi:hypothetical protein
VKAIFKVGWREYVLSVEDATAMLDILTKAERYEKNFDRDKDTYSYHIWRDAEQMEQEMTLISDDRYRAAKLVGKREES